ncbi:MAG: pirin family protein [Bacteroidota bacterium]|nr:pirin family protein [Bacteroidota bacterium]
MKTVIHKADTRGHETYGWLNTYHTFSFSDYYDHERVHFGALRVLNDDYISAGAGFGMHPHDNMEIVTIPLAGVLEHKDSMGHTQTIARNDVQIISAGSGIKHSEYNKSKDSSLNLLQIWVFPKEKNIKSGYDQETFNEEERKNKFQIIVAPDNSIKSLWINQDAWFSIGSFEKGRSTKYDLKMAGNGMYMFLIEGKIEVNGIEAGRRDGIGIWETDELEINTIEDSEILIIEVPMK